MDVNIYLIVNHVEDGQVIHGVKAVGWIPCNFDELPQWGDKIDLGGVVCDVITVDDDLPDYPLIHVLLDVSVEDDRFEYYDIIEHVINMGMKVEEI